MVMEKVGLLHKLGEKMLKTLGGFFSYLGIPEGWISGKWEILKKMKWRVLKDSIFLLE